MGSFSHQFVLTNLSSVPHIPNVYRTATNLLAGDAGLEPATL